MNDYEDYMFGFSISEEYEDVGYEIVENPELWKKLNFDRTIEDKPIVLDPEDQEHIARVFRYVWKPYAERRHVENDVTKHWLNNIPSEGKLKLGDVYAVKTRGVELPVLGPPDYDIQTLDASHYMFHDNGANEYEVLKYPYGLFHADGSVGKRNDIRLAELKKWPVNGEDHFHRFAVSGSKKDMWFVLHPALLQHALAWPLWHKKENID